MLNCIGVLAHPHRPQTTPTAEGIVNSLKARGIKTWSHTQWDENSIQADVPTAQIVVAIGGDGAMLKAGRVCAKHNVPMLGINMGRLGFLTEVQAVSEWETALDKLLAGDYWLETRMMIHATLKRGKETLIEGEALNDFVISGNMMGNMVQLDTYIDNHWTTTYNADGLIIATPTGSTAYALASGGPILPPDLKNILIVPSAPHLSMDRPIILSEGSTVAVRPSPSNRNSVTITADGTLLGMLGDADTLYVRASHYPSHFVRMRPKSYFYRSLLDKLEPRINRRVDGVLSELED